MDEIYRSYTIARILAASKPAANGCRLWNGAKNKGGYGLISITKDRMSDKRTMTSAHRAMYLAKTGKALPSNIQVLHKCDNPACVEFDHLFEGTAKLNMQDCITKGRRAKHHRAHSRLRTFTDEEIKAIRQATGKLKDIADRFGTSTGYVKPTFQNRLSATATPDNEEDW